MREPTSTLLTAPAAKPARKLALSVAAHAVSVSVLALSLAGCFAVSEDKLSQKVRAQMAQGKYKEATLELRSFLNDKPRSAVAHFLLGEVLMSTGQWPDGVRELERALERGHPEKEAVPALIRAKLKTDKADDVLRQFGSKTLEDKATGLELKALLAQAQLMKGNVPQAQALADEVLAQDANNVVAQIVKLRLQAKAAGSYTAQREAVAKLAERHPQVADAQALLGDSLLGSDSPAAVAAFKRALQADPTHVRSHTALIGEALSRSEANLARNQAGALFKAVPTLGLSAYYQGMTAYLTQDYAAAREWLQALMRGGSTNPRVTFLAGAAEAKLGNLAQAEALLNKTVLAMPSELQPRLELAQLYLRRGNAERSLQTLEPVTALEASQVPNVAWSLLGQAHSLAGDFKKADEAFERAKRSGSANSAEVRTQQARSLLARGEVDAGLRNLRELLDDKQAGVDAEMALTSALLSRGDFDGALKALDAAGERRPNTPVLDLLRSAAYTGKLDASSAGRALELAIRKDPYYLPAIERLASIDLRQGNAESAAKRYNDLLRRDPRSVPALLAMADITRARGNSLADSNAWLEKAVAASPRDGRVWAQALQHHMRRQNPSGAAAWGQRGVAAVPDDLDLLFRLTEVQLMLGDTEQAIAMTTRLVAARPEQASYRILAARAYAAGKRVSQARAQITKALELEPDNLVAQSTSVSLYLAESKPDQALAAARSFQTRNPKQPMASWLLSEVLERRGDKAGALASARQALDAAPMGDSGIRYLNAVARLGNAAEAEQFIQGWQARNPKDALFMGQAAVWHDSVGQKKKAEGLYRSALELSPDNPVALNNLAFFLFKSGEAAKGLPMAELAVKRAPEVASFHDTLARIHLATGNKDLALKSQLKAVALAPRSNDMMLELARIYIANNEKTKARNELSRLSDLGGKYKRQDEVQRLLREAGG